MKFCLNCGKEIIDEAEFCPNCGTEFADEAVVSNIVSKKKLSKKLVVIGSACIALVLVAAIVFLTFFTGESSLFNNVRNRDLALYVKDKELFLTNTSKIKPRQVTTHLFDINEKIDSEDISYFGEELGECTCLSKDGNILFYIDKINDASEGFSLFYRYVNKPEQEPIKIDSDVQYYSVSDSGKIVTYIKGYEGSLYQHNLNDKEKIDSEISVFKVSNDGKKIIYINKDNEMYLKSSGKDKEKLDSEVSEISYVNKKLNTVYYLKEGSLYKRIIGKDKEKIASDVSSVIKVYKSGEIYYLKSDSREVKLIDYIEDDMKDTDAAMVEPISPEYPSYWDYYNYDNYYYDYDEYASAVEQYDKAYDEYMTAKYDWYDREFRDELREELAEKTITNQIYAICCYNGKEEKVLSDNCVYQDVSDCIVAKNNPVIIFSTFDASVTKKVKLSEISYVSEAEEMVEETIYSSIEKNIAIKDNSSVIEQTKANNFVITSDGKTVYFVDEISEENYHGALYKMDILGNNPKKPELYDNDVYQYGVDIISDNKVVYYKSVNDLKGELYVDKQLIDYDVELWCDLIYTDKTDNIVYICDWNEEKEYGTLKKYNNGKSEKIADDVHEFNATPNGEILYLCEYNTNRSKGELYTYNGGKVKKIDDDVVSIIPICDIKYRGGKY